MPALYLHIPFCRSKCPYCDFFSLEQEGAALAAYPSLLIRHLEAARKTSTWQGSFASVFFGGGTPSLLPPGAVDSILRAAERLFGLTADAEISLEANPGTVSEDSLAGYRQAGVNRLSLGVQSLQDEKLQLLGRPHSAADARQAITWARGAGFDNLSADLIFALPGQPKAQLLEDLDELAMVCDHLSCYGLTVEEDTPFAHRHRLGELPLPDQELYAELFLAVGETLRRRGYSHYEISNYARPGFECRHNNVYWRRSGYLGVGPGAHSFIDRGWGERRSVPADLDRYSLLLQQEELPDQLLETFDRRGAMAETLYLGLRTAAGVSESEFARRFGQSVADAFPEAVTSSGRHLRRDGDRWHFTADGWLLFDRLILPFLG